MPRKLPDYLPADWPDHAEIPTRDEWNRAQEEDHIANVALARMRRRRPSTVPTPESIAAGDAAMAQAYARAAEVVVRRIESRELLSIDEFCEAVGVTRDWLSDALTEGRVFAIAGPHGRSFFPSFYADARIERAAIEQVARILSPRDPSSQYWFFFSVRTSLQSTPLEALRAGRLDAVIRAAEMHAEGAPPRVLSVVEELAVHSGPLTVPMQHDPSESFADVLNGVKGCLGKPSRA